MTVAITASRRASELAHIVESFGGKPYIAPTIGIEADLKKPSKDVLQFLNKVTEGDIDYVIFMTAPGVFSLISIANILGLEEKLVHSLAHVTIVARSLKPKMALKKYGVEIDFVPEENTAEGVLRLLLDKGVVGKKIAILWHGDYPRELKDNLYRAGAESVIEASTYKYSLELKKEGASILKSMGYDYIAPDEKKVIQLIYDIIAGKIGSITFTSPPSARDLVKIAEVNNLSEVLKNSLNSHVVVVAVGPSTKSALEENGIDVHVIPQTFKMGPMIKALDEFVSQKNTVNGNRPPERNPRLFGR
ncbi:uroporphyrinogen-III synthase [soil metagenome]